MQRAILHHFCGVGVQKRCAHVLLADAVRRNDAKLTAVCTSILRYGHAFPLHPLIKDSQNEVEDTVIAEFAFWPALGPREMREDKCDELWFGELHGDRL